MKAVISETYGKVRIYREMSKCPAAGDEWIGDGYEDAKVVAWVCVNDEVAETSSGDPKEEYDFYRITVAMPDVLDGSTQEFTEYISVRKQTPKEKYDARTARYYSLKLNRNTDADIIDKLESVDSIQGYIKRLIRQDIK